MAILRNIDDCYLYTNLLMRKQYSGSLSADEWNLLAPIAQATYMRVKLGLTEDYKITVGYPGQGARRGTIILREAAQELEASQELSDQIRNFLTQATITGTNNLFTVPTDYIAYRPSNYRYTWQVLDEETNTYITQWALVPFEWVTSGQRTYRLYQYIKVPSPEYPIISYSNGNLQVNADTQGRVIIPSINLEYVRMPLQPIRNYTPNANDQPIYNPVGSQDFEFPNIDWEPICMKIVELWAMAIRDNEAYQMADKRIITGQ